MYNDITTEPKCRECGIRVCDSCKLCKVTNCSQAGRRMHENTPIDRHTRISECLCRVYPWPQDRYETIVDLDIGDDYHIPVFANLFDGPNVCMTYVTMKSKESLWTAEYYVAEDDGLNVQFIEAFIKSANRVKARHIEGQKDLNPSLTKKKKIPTISTDAFATLYRNATDSTTIESPWNMPTASWVVNVPDEVEIG